MSCSRRPGPIGASEDHCMANVHEFPSSRLSYAWPVGVNPLAWASRPVHTYLPQRSGLAAQAQVPGRLPVRDGSPSASKSLPMLRAGGRGLAVEKLQCRLNQYTSPSVSLKVDGNFGPLTEQAVKQYQSACRISVDGIVGNETWYELLKGTQGSVEGGARAGQQPANASGIKRSPSHSLVHSTTPAVISPPPRTVGDWTLEEKFTEVLKRTAPRLPTGLRREFEALLTPESLAIMAGTFVVWAGSHAFGVGEVADIALVVVGAAFVGLAILDVARALGNCIHLTVTADSHQELDQAADELARAIAIVGVTGLIALLAKVAHSGKGKGARKSGGGAGVAEEGPVRASNQPKESPTAKSKGSPAAEPTEVNREKPATSQAHAQRTTPSGKPGGKPLGEPKKVLPQDDAATQRSIRRENESAEIMAEAGYDVKRLPERANQKNPDYSIEGRLFDCKAPEGPSARNAASEMEKAVRKGQADRIILNLEDSPIALEQMKSQLTEWPIEGLKEVIAIKNGQIVPLFP